MTTAFLYIVLCYSLGSNNHIKEIWNKSNTLLRVLIASFICTVIAGHVQQFGASVFGVIPKRVGGGKPETVYIKPASQHADLLSALNLSGSNSVSSNGFFGPIAILLRSDKEVFFINLSDLNPATDITNITTNLLANVVTNISTSAAVTYQTNLVPTLRTNVTKNPLKPRAKQVRAELIDSIDFTP